MSSIVHRHGDKRCNSGFFYDPKTNQIKHLRPGTVESNRMYPEKCYKRECETCGQLFPVPGARVGFGWKDPDPAEGGYSVVQEDAQKVTVLGHDEECMVDFCGKYLGRDTKVFPDHPEWRLCKRCNHVIDFSVDGGKDLGFCTDVPKPTSFMMVSACAVGIPRFGKVRVPMKSVDVKQEEKEKTYVHDTESDSDSEPASSTGAVRSSSRKKNTTDRFKPY